MMCVACYVFVNASYAYNSIYRVIRFITNNSTSYSTDNLASLKVLRNH